MATIAVVAVVLLYFLAKRMNRLVQREKEGYEAVHGKNSYPGPS